MCNKLPENLYRFFWAYDPKTIRLNEHAHLIMMRLMERGHEWLAEIKERKDI